MKDDTSFAEQWQAAVTLADVRGWLLDREPDTALRVRIHPEEPSTYVYPYDAAGLAALIHQLSQDDPKPMSHAKYKTYARFSHGFTDPRALYGSP